MNERIKSSLHNSELFCNMPDTIINSVLAIGKIRYIDEKSTLFHEGFPGRHFYVLLEGSVKIIKTDYAGKESIIKFIEPGEIFAEAIIMGNENYPAGARAISDSTLIEIDRDSFIGLLDNRQLRDDFIISLFRKMAYLTSRIQYLSACDVEERFFQFICERYGKKYEYDINLPKKDIAVAIGTIPETFSRTIARLKKQGSIIAWSNGTMQLRSGIWDEIMSNKKSGES